MLEYLPPQYQGSTQVTCEDSLKNQWLSNLASYHTEDSVFTETNVHISNTRTPIQNGTNLSISQFFLTVTSFFSSSRRSENTEIHRLQRAGWEHLPRLLQTVRRFPWNEIHKIQDLELIEQMVEIALLCQSQSSLRTTRKYRKLQTLVLHLMGAVESIASTQPALQKQRMLAELKLSLSQLIYLLDHGQKEQVFALLHLRPPFRVVTAIRSAFHEAMASRLHQLHTKCMAYQKTGLQPVGAALPIQLSQELADILLTSTGHLNIGLAPILSKIFLSNPSSPDYENTLKKSLNTFLISPKTRDTFWEVVIPSHPKAMQLIRSSLQLGPDAVIGTQEVKRTLLSGLLSHPRQGKNGSCFAAALVIEEMSNHFLSCVKNLKTLLQTGIIQRNVRGIQYTTPLSCSISDETLLIETHINPHGLLTIRGQSSLLWTIPGLQAVCISLGLPCTKDLFSHLLPSTSLKKISIKQILTYLVEQVPNGTEHLDELLEIASFSFSAQTAPPLLKAWENTIASMTENTEGGMIKSAAIKAILDGLEYALSSKKIPPSPPLQHLFLQIQKHLHESVEIRYEACLFSPDISLESSGNGRFVLHASDKKISSKEAFLSFVQEIIKKGFTTCREPKTSLLPILETLTEYTKSDSWLCYTLIRYHKDSRNQIEKAVLNNNYHKLRFTPWATQCGHNSRVLLARYFELPIPLPTLTFQPKNSHQALAYLIGVYQKKPFPKKTELFSSPHTKDAFWILGKHRFSLMPGHPKFVAAWNTPQEGEEWIREKLLLPGQKVASSEISNSVRAFIEEAMFRKKEVNISKTERLALLQALKKIPSPSHYQTYRKEYMQILARSRNWSQEKLDILAQALDKLLFETLDPHRKSLLIQTSITFADTNWSLNKNDLHFAFIVNPGTGEIEMWQTDSKNVSFTPLNQNEWVIGQSWEIPSSTLFT